MTGEVAKEFEAAVLLDFIHLREGGRKKLLVFRFRGKPLLFPFPVVSVLHLLPAADKPATPAPLPIILEVMSLDVKVFITSNVLSRGSKFKKKVFSVCLQNRKYLFYDLMLS